MIMALRRPRPASLILILLAIFLFVPVLFRAASAQEAPAALPAGGAGLRVVVIPVEGMIDGGLFDSITRRVDEAKAIGATIIVFRIDTYGGLLDAALEITDAIGEIESPKTVAYVPRKAYSAGAMIAMACREIVLSPTASIGDAAPVVPTAEGSKILGEKEQSPTRNIFRKYAERNGYPVPLAEAMVTPEIEVWEVTFEGGRKQYLSSTDIDGLPEAEKAKITAKRIVDQKDRLLTMTAGEAVEFGFAKHVVKNFDELLAAYGMPAATVVTLETNWSETLVRFLNHPAISGIILLIGIIGLYTEFKAPGLGLPGAVAVVCFGLFFFSKHLSGMAEYWEILVFLIGLVLLGIEIFLIPGFGIIGFIGAGMMLAGIALMLMPGKITTAPMDIAFMMWTAVYSVGALIGAFVFGVLLAKFLPKTPVLSAVYLGAPDTGSVPHKEGAGVTGGRNLVGATGTAITMLRPAGKAEIGGDILDVTTQGDLVPKGAKIEVIAEKSNNIIVKEIK